MDNRDGNFWFHVKSYGFGWGLPASWQGWVSLVIYIALVLTVILFAPQDTKFIFIGVLTILFVILVVFTGERPAKWRWGKDRNTHGSPSDTE